MLYGHIARVVPEHRFGFLVDDAGLEWFFVVDGVRDGAFEHLWIDERVGFRPEWTERGPRAIDIHFEQLD
jgi:hypothetical protein